MSLYDICYNFFLNYIFNNSYLTSHSVTMFGGSLPLGQYLSHTCTFISMGLVIVFFIKLIIYFSKWFGGLFKF